MSKASETVAEQLRILATQAATIVILQCDFSTRRFNVLSDML
jgi:hypothetical protein